MLFISGKWVWTHAVNDKVADDPEFARFVFTSIKRHCAGDWGDLCREDKAENRLALEHGLDAEPELGVIDGLSGRR